LVISLIISTRSWGQVIDFLAYGFYYGILWGFVSLFGARAFWFLRHLSWKSGFSSLDVRNIYLALENIQLWFAIF
jgi:hypothetical protein